MKDIIHFVVQIFFISIVLAQPENYDKTEESTETGIHSKLNDVNSPFFNEPNEKSIVAISPGTSNPSDNEDSTISNVIKKIIGTQLECTEYADHKTDEIDVSTLSSQTDGSLSSGETWSVVKSNLDVPTSSSVDKSPNQRQSPPSTIGEAATYLWNSVLSLITPGVTQKVNINTSTPAPEIASNEELIAMSEALLERDVNNVAQYVTLNIQGKVKSSSKEDFAPEPLFKVDPVVWNVPTVLAIRRLYDNYEQDVRIEEDVTDQEINEENTFLNVIFETPVMHHLLQFLKEKGIVTGNKKEQLQFFKQSWFDMYPRSRGSPGSSGFEHIFLSEIKKNKISGLHNWLYFHSQEASQQVNYLGYMRKIDIGNKGSILKFSLDLKGIYKPVTSAFVGTSPELEMALYSLCFYTRVNKPCRLSLGGKRFNLRTHSYSYKGKRLIGSAFPEI